MKNTIMNVLASRSEYITKLDSRVQNKLKELPEGRIKIKHIHNKRYFYHIEKGSGEKLLGKDSAKTIEGLIQKNYLEIVKRACKKELKVLANIKKQYNIIRPEDIYSQLSPDRQAFITPIIFTDEQFVERWQNSPYTHKPISKDAPVYETMKGERVRSKSEMIIADRLKANNIPYKYECPIKAGVRIIHPDFTILRVSDRKILYLEHCGKVGDKEYGDDMVDRINDYAQEGIVIGDRLFITCESENKPFDVRVLDEMIEKVFR